MKIKNHRKRVKSIINEDSVYLTVFHYAKEVLALNFSYHLLYLQKYV